MERKRAKSAAAPEASAGGVKIFLIFVGAASVFFGGFSAVEAASLYLSPASGNFYKNENFTVSVLVDSDTAINAVQGTISFPTGDLGVIEVRSDGDSMVDLWVRKPSFSNSGALGNVYFEGVVLNPGFTGSRGRILDIVFRVKKEGSAEVGFSDSSVLANDGLGTNVLTSNGKADFSLLPARQVPPTPAQENLSSIEKRIQEVEEKVGLGGPTAEKQGLTGFWSFLPEWLAVLLMVLLGVLLLLLSVVVLGFVVVVLIWLWNYVRRRGEEVERGFGSLPHRLRAVARGVLRVSKLAEEELKGDVRYGVHEFGKDLAGAKMSRSLAEALKDYWRSILKVLKRFTTKNNK
jgi:hypothetical protein